MISWLELFFYSITIVAILLSVLGISFTAIVPGIDRWSKRFFISYFFIFLLCGLSVLIEGFFEYYDFPIVAIYTMLVVESFLLFLPLPMLAVYLLHCTGESMHGSKLLRAVLGLSSIYNVVLIISSFIEKFGYVSPDKQYHRGPLYPLLLIPLDLILLVNLAGVIKRREKLSRKVFRGFLIAILPMAAALTVQMFIDVFPLVDISIVLSAIVMLGFVVFDQVEQTLRNQQEIARQQLEIAQEKANVMVLQMRPHFIYNTLMSIYSLCNQDPQKARQVTADFTNYLRKNFNAVAAGSAIPFTAELEHTRAYLAVEQAQHEDMLLVDYDTPFTNFRLPPLTLQPIVENAVKHGMNPYSGPLHILVRTQHTEAGIEIIVEDDGTGFDPSDESTPKTALTNIRERLEMMCGGTMTITPRDGGGTVVKIMIPPAHQLSGQA